MVKAGLVLRIAGDRCDAFMFRECCWFPVIPRIGESIDIGGQAHIVHDVQHYLMKRKTEVWCHEVSLIDMCEAYLELKGGWELIDFSAKLRKEFFRVLEERGRLRVK